MQREKMGMVVSKRVVAGALPEGTKQAKKHANKQTNDR